jgi:hypothetical protein
MIAVGRESLGRLRALFSPQVIGGHFCLGARNSQWVGSLEVAKWDKSSANLDILTGSPKSAQIAQQGSPESFVSVPQEYPL